MTEEDVQLRWICEIELGVTWDNATEEQRQRCREKRKELLAQTEDDKRSPTHLVGKTRQ